MVNNTVNGKKIGKAAGYKDKTIIVAEQIKQLDGNKKELSVPKHVDRNILTISNLVSKEDIVNETAEFISIKAYPGGREKTRNVVTSSDSNERN